MFASGCLAPDGARWYDDADTKRYETLRHGTDTHGDARRRTETHGDAQKRTNTYETLRDATRATEPLPIVARHKIYTIYILV